MVVEGDAIRSDVRGEALVGVVEVAEIVQFPSDELFVVKKRLGEEVTAPKDAVAWEPIGDALHGDRRIELHHAAVACHHPYHQLTSLSKTPERAVTHIFFPPPFSLFSRKQCVGEKL